MNKTVSGIPFWTAVNNTPTQYPWLDKPETCDVAIIGAGITGAFCAMRFAQAGVNTVLLGGGPVAQGCSMGSAGIAQYGTCEGMIKLSRKRGNMDSSARIYELLYKAVDNLETLSGELDADIGFIRRDKLSYVTERVNAEALRQEYLAQRHNNFDVELAEPPASMQDFSFEMAAGIYAKNAAAEMDPFLLCHALAGKAADAGARVYENTRVEQVESRDGLQHLYCSTRRTVKARRVIFASGCDNARHFPLQSAIRTAFTVVTSPVESFSGWKDLCIISTHAPYPITLRTTPGNRIMASGLETGMWGVSGKLAGTMPMSQLINRKYGDLTSRIREMFPGIRAIQPEYAYVSSFAETPDGLPLIGTDKNGNYFAISPGVNGIAYAEIISRMLLSDYVNASDRDFDLFAAKNVLAMR